MHMDGVLGVLHMPHGVSSGRLEPTQCNTSSGIQRAFSDSYPRLRTAMSEATAQKLRLTSKNFSSNFTLGLSARPRAPLPAPWLRSAAKFPLSCAPRATFRMTSSALATGNPIAAAMASRSTAPGRQRVGPRRQAYSAEYKLKVVREALKRPPSNRIKPTCRDFPGIEPARSPHPPGVSISG